MDFNGNPFITKHIVNEIRSNDCEQQLYIDTNTDKS